MTKNLQYDHTKVEKKWQERWEKEGIYNSVDKPVNKKYVLDMFPYPSAATMHVGHLEGYVGTDIYTRYLRMRGDSVLHPMGWDAFGLPAENYAIKTGINPDQSTHGNIKTFKRQLKNSGLSYDWDREIDTSSPDFYKWTQWLFILMSKRGLAYKKKAPVNWCPKDETVLANEQVIDGKCERCETSVIQKELDQWFFKITAYADRLISGLNDIDWPEDIKIQQRNWIGKSEGRTIEFEVESSGKKIRAFTTRPETLNSATFLAVASKEKTKLTEKWGQFTGQYALNPLNGERLPIWETNYVESTYGTGAIMGVPAYDERDKDFTNKYHIDIVKRPFTKEILGEKTVHYHLRDWLISRQRYWGCPIPMIYCEDDGWQSVPEKDLPVLLPTDVDFLPHGESPIARSKTFQKGVKCPKCGQSARREVDTMDTYVDSSWYFIRFVDPKNKEEFASNESIKKWLPVDVYVGGGHVIQHLLFARFFWKVLFDEGLIDNQLGDEPFLKLRAPGWILGSDSRKMSKRWGNAVTPDDIIPKFGADTLRVYEMFMGPFDALKPWSVEGVEGASRFLSRVWKIFNGKTKEKENTNVTIKMHQTIKKVTEDIQEFKYNTAIAAIMEYVNVLADASTINPQTLTILAKLMAPFAPHLAEEVWHTVLGNKDSIHTQPWPKYNPKYLQVGEVKMVIQVNGKVRAILTVNSEQSKSKLEIEELAKKDPKIVKWLNGRVIKNTIFIDGKLVNFVI